MNGKMFRRGGVVAVAVVTGLAMLLGGCSSNKKKAELTEQENSELREKVASLESQVGEKQNRIAELEGRLAAQPPAPVQGYDQPYDNPGTPGRRTSRGDGGGDFVRGASGRPTATLSGDVLFDSGQVTIKQSAKKTLDRIASEIKRDYGRASVRVEGYTDSDPIRKSKWGSNEQLSMARAEAVRKYLTTRGISDSRLDAVGMGSANPKSTKAASRRVEIVIMN